MSKENGVPIQLTKKVDMNTFTFQKTVKPYRLDPSLQIDINYEKITKAAIALSNWIASNEEERLLKVFHKMDPKGLLRLKNVIDKIVKE